MPVTTNLGLAVSSNQQDYVLEYWMKMLNQENGNFVLLDNEFGTLASKLAFTIYPQTWVAEEHAPFYYKSTVTIAAVVQDNSIVEAYFENILVSTGVILHSVTQNGTNLELVFYADSAKQSEVKGFIKYVYSVPGQAPLPVPSANVEPKTITQNGVYDAHDVNKDGYNPITVSVPANVVPLSVSANGTYSAPENADGYAPVSVNVPDLGEGILNKTIEEVEYSSVLNISPSIFQSCYNLKKASFPNCLSIGNYAFANCYALTEASFPKCLTVGARAFMFCSNLKKINLSNCTNISSYAFMNCLTLTEVNLPNLLIISSYAFSSCRALTEAIFPNCSYIGEDIFAYCSSLNFLSFPMVDTLTSYQQLYHHYLLSRVNIFNIQTIGESTFNACSSLSEIYILNMSTNATTLANANVFANTPMDNSTYLGYYGSIYVHPDRVSMFKTATNWVTYSDRIVAAPSEVVNKGVWAYEYYNRSDITEVPSEKLNAEIIGPSAFYSCSQLSMVSLPECEHIGSYAFSNCSALAIVNLPKCGLIRDSLFYNCSALSSISFPNCTYIGNYAFLACTSLASVNFPNCLYIGNYAFLACTSLASISFPNCAYIGTGVFFNCSSLTQANFPNCLSIGENAFSGCYSLTSVSFPNCLSIGNYVFYQCSKLSQAYFLASAVATLATGVFQGTPMSASSYLGYFGSIYVRASLLSQYQVAPNWSWYSARLVGLTDEEIANL